MPLGCNLEQGTLFTVVGIGRPVLNLGTQFRFCSEFCQRALSKQISETRRTSGAETIHSCGKLRNYYSAAETAIWSTAKFTEGNIVSRAKPILAARVHVKIAVNSSPMYVKRSLAVRKIVNEFSKIPRVKHGSQNVKSPFRLRIKLLH